jgi:chromosomal replication initiation ATPase DnaA
MAFDVARSAYVAGRHARGAGIAPIPLQPSIGAIQQRVAEYYEIQLDDMTSRMWRRAARPRHVAMYIANQTGQLSLTDIGLQFGRDRSTVRYAIEKIESLCESDPAFRGEVEMLCLGEPLRRVA